MRQFENIAEELKKLRRQQGWSQEDLAHNLGVSFATVNRWENGKTKPSKLALVQIKNRFLKASNERDCNE